MAFSPTDRPRILVSEDGSLAAIREAFRVTLVNLPPGTPATTLELDPAAHTIDLGWVGAPVRLIVLSRYAAHTTVQMFDSRRTHAIAELWVEARLRLAATTGLHALIVGTVGSAVLTAGDATLAATQWPGAAVPQVAGNAVARFAVVNGASIELWDPLRMQVTHRFPAPEGREVTRIGGNLRRLWMTTQEDARRVDIVELDEHGRASSRDLPEPIEAMSGAPSCELVACIGASGTLFVVDLARDEPPRPIPIAGLDRVESAAIVAGEPVGVLAAHANCELRHFVVRAGVAGVPAAVSRGRGDALAERSPSRAVPRISARWRDNVVEWARDVEAGHVTMLPPAPPIDTLLDRLGLPERFRPCMFLLYGVGLGGAPGASPRDVRRVLGPTWDDALGRGALSTLGVASYSESRVCLSRALRHVLDELPAASGTLIGDASAASPQGRFVVIADEATEGLAGVAERCLPRVGGAILVAGSGADVVELFLEARARGATPLLRAPHDISAVPLGPAILVVGDPAASTRLGLPLL